MSCKGHCNEPQQTLIERLITQKISELILNGQLCQWLKHCLPKPGDDPDSFVLEKCLWKNGKVTGNAELSAGDKLVTCATLQDIFRQIKEDIHLSQVNVDSAHKNIELILNDGNRWQIDLSTLFSDGGQGQDIRLSHAALIGQTLRLTLSDNTRIEADLSSLSSEAVFQDRVIKSLQLNGTQLEITYGTDSNPNLGQFSVNIADLIHVSSDGITVLGDGTAASPLQAPKSPQQLSLDGTTLILTLHDGTRLNQDLNALFTGNTDDEIPSSNTSELPTTIHGNRTALLGKPDRTFTIQLDGKTYLIPAYEKP